MSTAQATKIIVRFNSSHTRVRDLKNEMVRGEYPPLEINPQENPPKL